MYVQLRQTLGGQKNLKKRVAKNIYAFLMVLSFGIRNNTADLNQKKKIVTLDIIVIFSFPWTSLAQELCGFALWHSIGVP